MKNNAREFVDFSPMLMACHEVQTRNSDAQETVVLPMFSRDEQFSFEFSFFSFSSDMGAGGLLA